VLRPGGLVVGIGGPPDPQFASYLGRPLLRPVFALISRPVRAAAKKLGARYSFLFMRASGDQLREITALVDAGVIRPVIDRTFDFTDTPAALEYVDSGHAKGKVVITMAMAPTA
jgi:NADPH:quinone reductase-like Zn-dependent oxidoreductase